VYKKQRNCGDKHRERKAASLQEKKGVRKEEKVNKKLNYLRCLLGRGLRRLIGESRKRIAIQSVHSKFRKMVKRRKLISIQRIYEKWFLIFRSRIKNGEH
jgi:hypothetical protein